MNLLHNVSCSTSYQMQLSASHVSNFDLLLHKRKQNKKNVVFVSGISVYLPTRSHILCLDRYSLSASWNLFGASMAVNLGKDPHT